MTDITVTLMTVNGHTLDKIQLNFIPLSLPGLKIGMKVHTWIKNDRFRGTGVMRAWNKIVMPILPCMWWLTSPPHSWLSMVTRLPKYQLNFIPLSKWAKKLFWRGHWGKYTMKPLVTSQWQMKISNVSCRWHLTGISLALIVKSHVQLRKSMAKFITGITLDCKRS